VAAATASDSRYKSVVLDRVADEVFTIARPQRYFRIEVGTRTTIVRMRDGELFVHCPSTFDDDLRRSIDALGEVTAIACSSLYHHLYVMDWARAYPKALLCACPGLEKKRPDVPWGHILSDEPHPLWKDDLDQVFFSARFEKEVVFFHRASRTMICADALLNLSGHRSRLTRIVSRLMGNSAPGKGYLEYVAVRDWKKARRQVDRMLLWDIDRIVLAHGNLVDRDGRNVLRDAYAWL